MGKSGNHVVHECSPRSEHTLSDVVADAMRSVREWDGEGPLRVIVALGAAAYEGPIVIMDDAVRPDAGRDAVRRSDVTLVICGPARRLGEPPAAQIHCSPSAGPVFNVSASDISCRVVLRDLALRHDDGDDGTAAAAVVSIGSSDGARSKLGGIEVTRCVVDGAIAIQLDAESGGAVLVRQCQFDAAAGAAAAASAAPSGAPALDVHIRGTGSLPVRVQACDFVARGLHIMRQGKSRSPIATAVESAAAGSDDETLVVGADSSAIVAVAVAVEGCTLQRCGIRCVIDPTLVLLASVGSPPDAAAAANDATWCTCAITANAISRFRGAGIMVHCATAGARFRAHIVGNDVRECGGFGIVLRSPLKAKAKAKRGTAIADILSNTLASNKKGGVTVLGALWSTRAAPLPSSLEACGADAAAALESSARGGERANASAPRASIVACGNSFIRCGVAISLKKGISALVAANTLRSSMQAAVVVDEGVRAAIALNEVRDGEDSGIVVNTHSDVAVVGNVLERNHGFALIVMRDASVRSVEQTADLTLNTLTENGAAAKGKGPSRAVMRLVLTTTSVAAGTESSSAPVSASTAPTSLAWIHHNVVHSSKGDAVAVVVKSPSSSPTPTPTLSSPSALVASEGGKVLEVVVDSNDVSNNAGCAIRVESATSLIPSACSRAEVAVTVTRNVVAENGQDGVACIGPSRAPSRPSRPSRSLFAAAANALADAAAIAASRSIRAQWVQGVAPLVGAAAEADAETDAEKEDAGADGCFEARDDGSITVLVGHNAIVGNGHAGVALRRGSCARVEHNSFSSSGSAAVLLCDAATAPSVRWNAIKASRVYGVYAYDDAAGSIRCNRVVGHGMGGVVLEAGARPDVSLNVIDGGGESGADAVGLWVHGDAGGSGVLLARNVVHSHGGANVQIESSDAEVCGNVLDVGVSDVNSVPAAAAAAVAAAQAAAVRALIISMHLSTKVVRSALLERADALRLEYGSARREALRASLHEKYEGGAAAAAAATTADGAAAAAAAGDARVDEQPSFVYTCRRCRHKLFTDIDLIYRSDEECSSHGRQQKGSHGGHGGDRYFWQTVREQRKKAMAASAVGGDAARQRESLSSSSLVEEAAAAAAAAAEAAAKGEAAPKPSVGGIEIDLITPERAAEIRLDAYFRHVLKQRDMLSKVAALLAKFKGDEARLFSILEEKMGGGLKVPSLVECAALSAASSTARSHGATAALRSAVAMPKGSTTSTCSSIFLAETHAWMGMKDEGGSNYTERKLCCPSCAHKLGVAKWFGLPCSCGTWVTPGFQISKGKVDRKRVVV